MIDRVKAEKIRRTALQDAVAVVLKLGLTIGDQERTGQLVCEWCAEEIKRIIGEMGGE
jgi:hypothetical protein